MGSILALNQQAGNEQIILIDPILDIADAIHQKYGYLYPKFLVRTNFKVNIDNLKNEQNNITVVSDRKQYENRTHLEYSKLVKAKLLIRDGESLQKMLVLALKRQFFE